MSDKDLEKIIQVAVINEDFRKGLLDENTRMATVKKGFQEEEFELDGHEKRIFKNLGSFEKIEDFTKALIKEVPELGILDTGNSEGERRI